METVPSPKWHDGLPPVGVQEYTLEWSVCRHCNLAKEFHLDDKCVFEASTYVAAEPMIIKYQWVIEPEPEP